MLGASPTSPGRVGARRLKAGGTSPEPTTRQPPAACFAYPAAGRRTGRRRRGYDRPSSRCGRALIASSTSTAVRTWGPVCVGPPERPTTKKTALAGAQPVGLPVEVQGELTGDHVPVLDARVAHLGAVHRTGGPRRVGGQQRVDVPGAVQHRQPLPGDPVLHLHHRRLGRGLDGGAAPAPAPGRRSVGLQAQDLVEGQLEGGDQRVQRAHRRLHLARLHLGQQAG